MMADRRSTEAMISDIVVPACETSVVPASTRSTLLPMSTLISRAASADRCARLRTSLATRQSHVLAHPRGRPPLRH